MLITKEEMGRGGGVGGVGKNWKAPAEAVGKKLSDDW